MSLKPRANSHERSPRRLSPAFFFFLLPFSLPFAALGLEVTFTAKPRPVGSACTISEEFRMDFTTEVIIAPASTGVLIEQYANVFGSTSRVQETLTGGNAEAVTAVKVFYQELTSLYLPPTEVAPGAKPEVQTHRSPVSGRTYSVQKQDKELSITDDKGQRVTEAEEEVVREDYEHLGRPDAVAAFFGGRTFKPGDKLDLPAAIVPGLIALKNQDNRIESAVLTFRATRFAAGRDCGVFDLQVKATKTDDSGMKFAISLSGELLVSIREAWPVALNLSGPVDLGTWTDEDGATVSAKGTMRVSVTHDYERR